MTEDILAVLEDYSKLFSVDPILVKAIVKKETDWVSWRTRYEPKWNYFFNVDGYAKKLGITSDTEKIHQATSYGLMQIMGSVARELGFEEYLSQLAEPSTGLYYGIKKLAQIYSRYNDMRDIASAYNAGTPRKIGDIKYFNEDYVVDIMNNYHIYKANPDVE